MNKKPNARSVVQLVKEEHSVSAWEALKIIEFELGAKFETQRAKFAGQAMQALIPNYRTSRSQKDDEAIASLSIRLADALILNLMNEK